MNNIIVNVYLRDILKEQQALNLLYNENWEKDYDLDKITLACISEVDELQREIQTFTTFFGAKYSSNFDLALEEFTDILHFSATKVLLNGYEEDNLEMHFSDCTTNTLVENLNTIPELVIGITKNICESDYGLKELKVLFELGLKLFGITPDLMLTAYLFKNSKNRDRAQAGAMGSNIDSIKENEVGTYSYLHENNFTAKGIDEFNQSLTWKYANGN